jgi:hypothetical protein
VTKHANITLRMRCRECKHEQGVTSALAWENSKGELFYYFGSRYDFCDKCDEPVEELKEVPH